MTERRYAPGELTRVLLAAIVAYPEMTPRELARRYGCTACTVRTILRQNGIEPLLEGRPRIVWTEDMKAILLRGLLKRRSANALSRNIGVSAQSLLSGAAEIIRDLHEQKGEAA